MSPEKSPIISGFFAVQTAILHLCFGTEKNRRFPFAAGLELPKSKYQICKADRNQKSICLFYYPQKGENRYVTERISQAAQGSLRHRDG